MSRQEKFNQIAENLRQIGTFLKKDGADYNVYSTSEILEGMDSSARKSTNVANPATPADIAVGRMAYVNGVLVTGTGENSVIPDGYYDTGDATASDGDIMQGKVAYGKNGAITGSYVKPEERDDDDLTVAFENSVLVARVKSGHYPNAVYKQLDPSIVNTAIEDDLSSPITSDAVLEGFTGFVNGEMIAGTMSARASNDISVSMSDGNLYVKLKPGYYSSLACDYTKYGEYCDTTVEPNVAAYSDFIADGKVAFINSAKVTGRVPVFENFDHVYLDNLETDTGKIKIGVADGFYKTSGVMNPVDRDGMAIRNTAYKVDKDLYHKAIFVDANHMALNYVAYANGEYVRGLMTPLHNYSLQFTYDYDVENDARKFYVSTPAGYYEKDTRLDLPLTVTDLDGATEITSSEVPLGHIVFAVTGSDENKRAVRVHGRALRYVGSTLLYSSNKIPDGFYQDCKFTLPANIVDTSESSISYYYADGGWISDDVLDGKTVFANGLKIRGTYVPEEGDELVWREGDFNLTELAYNSTYLITLDDDTGGSHGFRYGYTFVLSIPDMYDGPARVNSNCSVVHNPEEYLRDKSGEYLPVGYYKIYLSYGFDEDYTRTNLRVMLSDGVDEWEADPDHELFETFKFAKI